MLRSLVPIVCLAWSALLPAAEAPVRLEIADGNGLPGIAEEASRELGQGPFRVVRVADAPTQKYGQTFILYRQGFGDAAQALASRLPVKGWLRRTGSLGEGVDVRLLLGRDYAFQVRRAEAEREAAEAAARAAAEEAARTAAVRRGPRLEVSNGNGVAGMASRVRGFLQERDYTVASLTNADNFDYARSVIFYRPGLREAAADLAAILPVGNVRLVQDARQAADLRLVLGRDFVSYDINRLGGMRQVAGD